MLDRKVNDVGGLDGGPVEIQEHGQTFFEKRVDALLMLLVGPSVGAFRVDALRRVVEESTPEEYASLGYYEKWIRAIRQLLIEQEIMTAAEIERKMDEVRARLREAENGC